MVKCTQKALSLRAFWRGALKGGFNELLVVIYNLISYLFALNENASRGSMFFCQQKVEIEGVLREN